MIMALCCLNECIGTISEQDDIMCKPLNNRKCTDRPFLVFLIIFWLIFFGISIFAFSCGNARRFINGYDSFGNICGFDNQPNFDLPHSGKDFTNRQYLFFLNPNNLSYSPQICVEKCPFFDLENAKDLLSFYRQTNVSLCRYDINFEDYIQESNSSGNAPIRKFSEKGFGLCPKFPIPRTKPILNRCIPTHIVDTSRTLLYNFYSFFNSNDFIKSIVSDSMAAKNEICIMVISSILISYILMFFIHFFASFVAQIIIWIFLISILLITSLLWYTYLAIHYNWIKLPIKVSPSDYFDNERSILIIAIICSLISAILLLFVLVLRKQLQLIVALFYEAGSCIRSMPCLIFIPLRAITLIGFLTLYWLATSLFLISCEKLIKKDVMKELSTSYPLAIDKNLIGDSAYYSWIKFAPMPGLNWLFVYLLFALFWGIEFIIGCERTVVSGAVAAWYFTRDRSKLRIPLSAAMQIAFRKHLGSIGFASFLLVLFKIPKFIMLYLDQKLRENKQNQIVLSMHRCFAFIIYLIEKFVKFVGHNAYTMMMIQGTSFYNSAETAFNMIVTNAVKIAAINSVGDFILFLAKCSVAAFTSLIGLILLHDNNSVQFYAVPIIIGAFIAFWISNSVLSVYEMIIDSLFLCFCHDKKLNDGTPGREYYAPLSLMSLLGKDDENEIPLKNQSRSEASKEGDNLGLAN